MKWIPVTQRMPDLNRRLIVTVQYEGQDFKTVTDSEYVIDRSSDTSMRPTFQMGSAINFKVLAWMYEPEEYRGNDGIRYESTWIEKDCGYTVKRTLFKEI